MECLVLYMGTTTTRAAEQTKLKRKKSGHDHCSLSQLGTAAAKISLGFIAVTSDTEKAPARYEDQIRKILWLHIVDI